MAQFIALHNLPFQAADHLTDLFPSIFSDSQMTFDFSYKHTKTKAIIFDALGPYVASPITDLLKCTEFDLTCD